MRLISRKARARTGFRILVTDHDFVVGKAEAIWRLVALASTTMARLTFPAMTSLVALSGVTTWLLWMVSW